MIGIPNIQEIMQKGLEKAIQRYAEQSKRDKTDGNPIHFIWACRVIDHHGILKTTKDEMARFGLKRGMVSFLFKERFHCVTKETCEQLYKQGGQIRGDKMELSFGDDLEDFLNRIKNNEIRDHDYDPESWTHTFHLSLLTPDQKRKLAINDIDYNHTFSQYFTRSHDVPKEEMAKSESKSKYAFSKCTRGTYIISPEILLPENKQYGYKLPDPHAQLELLKPKICATDLSVNNK